MPDIIRLRNAKGVSPKTASVMGSHGCESLHCGWEHPGAWCSQSLLTGPFQLFTARTLELVPLVLLFIYNHPRCNLIRSQCGFLWHLFVATTSHEGVTPQKAPEVIVVFKAPNYPESVCLSLCTSVSLKDSGMHKGSLVCSFICNKNSAKHRWCFQL